MQKKRKRAGNNKPRPIVVKFNWHQDKEFVRINAKKLKGTKIWIAEQFPEEIESARKTLYPELRKAKAEGKKAIMVRDKLYIEGQVFLSCWQQHLILKPDILILGISLEYPAATKRWCVANSYWLRGDSTITIHTVHKLK